MMNDYEGEDVVLVIVGVYLAFLVADSSSYFCLPCYNKSTEI